MRVTSYPRGFLIGSEALRHVPEDFVRVADDLDLYVDRCADYGFRRGTGSTEAPGAPRVAAPFVFLTGNAADPDHPEDDLDAICARALAACQAGEPALIELAGRLSGRFALIWSDGGGALRLMADATGMRAVFACRRGAHGFAASHASLAAAQTDAVEEDRRAVKWGYPGAATPFRGVSLCPPATILSVGDLTRRRIPRHGETTPLTPADAATLIVSRAHSVLSSLLHRHACLVSLTAGADSRATLAVTSPEWSRLRFFTYAKGSRHDVDVALASRMSEAFNLDHMVLRPKSPDLPEILTPAIQTSSYYLHNMSVLPVYIETFGQNKYLHIRTNITELFRLSPVDKWCKKLQLTPDSPENAARLYMCMGG